MVWAASKSSDSNPTSLATHKMGHPPTEMQKQELPNMDLLERKVEMIKQWTTKIKYSSRQEPDKNKGMLICQQEALLKSKLFKKTHSQYKEKL